MSLLAASATAAVASPRTTGSHGHGASSKHVDRALGNGLGRLVQQSMPSAAAASPGLKIDQNVLGIHDSQGRVLVQLTPQAGVDAAAFRAKAEANGLVVQSVDASHGTLEGFVAVSAVPALAKLPGTGTLAQALRPHISAGSVTSQGVAFQRADKVQQAGIDGKGITIAALSDSYDTATQTYAGDPLTIHAADDVASGDLPGPGNPRNSKPVVVVDDSAAGYDEGRAMLQIAHDVAPAAKLCFASAFTGEVGFADNIRALADKSGPCRADVIVDDVSYYDEPFFSDGIVGDAVDDVAKKGVSYFSSAGNSGDKNAWESKVRLVPAAQGIAGTNLDFTNVDPSLYDGGLQDMNPGTGVDVAQNLTIGAAGGIFDLQWDDPMDIDGATYGDPIFTDTGDISDPQVGASLQFTTPDAQVGSVAEFRIDGIPSGVADLVLTVTAPDGSLLGPIDTGTSPETVTATLQAGTYTILAQGFDATGIGPFTATVRPVVSPSKVTTDFNVLLFGRDGTYYGALGDANRLTGRPFEIAGLGGLPDVQMVIARSGTGPMGATTLRYVTTDSIFVSEYADPLAPAVFGHPAARGATAVAAYDPFKPFLPEFFTSPGGVLPIYFDSAGNRYNRTQYRQVPQIASTDGGNTTFFVSDSSADPDTSPNFFGTSAAAPHAAAIAALLLQKAGGSRSLTPDQVRSRLSRSTFVHDLDPNHSGGTASGLTVSADGAQGDERDEDPGAMADPKFFGVSYTGRVPLRSVTFYGDTASPTALTSGGKGGIVFDPRPLGTAPFRDAGFPFTVGRASGGISAAAVSATFSQPVPTGQFRTMTVRFAGRGLQRGGQVQFGVDRDLTVPVSGAAPYEGNGADTLGGATFIPDRVAVAQGMKFVATRVDGSTFTGYFSNDLGRDWTALDGFGVVDAQQAVLNR